MKTFILGNLQTNCYLLWNDLSGEAIIIDSADDGDFLSEELLRSNLKLVAVVLTHGHFDHNLAAFELQANFNCPFLIHPKDIFLVKKIKESAEFWLKRKIIEKPPREISPLPKDFKLGNLKFKVVHAPGHTPGSICLYNQKKEVLFSGDTLFKNGIGRTDFSYSSFLQITKSLAKIRRLPEKTLIFPGHGKKFRL